MAEEQIIIEVVVDNAAAEKNIRSQTMAVDALTNANKDLQKENKELNKDYVNNSAKITDNNSAIAKNKAEINGANASRKASIKDLKTEDKSINSLRASLAKNTKERNALSQSTKEGRAEFKRLTVVLKSQSDQLKKLEGDAGDFRRQVGDYKQAFGEAAGGVKGFGTDLGSVFNLIKGNPIVLLVSAISGLIAIFAKSQTGIEFFRKAGAALNTTFGLLIDSVESLGIFLIDAFSNPKKSLDELVDSIENGIVFYFTEFIPNAIQKVIDGFVLLGEAASLVFDGEFTKAAEVGEEAILKLGDGLTDLNPVTALVKTGIEATVEVVKDLAEEINTATTAAYGLEDSMIANEKAIADQQVTVAQSIKSQKELNLLIEDQTASIADRITAGNKFARVEQDQITESIRLQEEKIALLKAQNDITNSTEEDIQRVRDAEIELANLQAASLERQVTNQNKLNTVKAQSNDLDKAKQKLIKDAAATERDAAFELDIFKRSIAANELEDAQKKADALISIEKDKSARLLENEQLTASGKLLIKEESDEAQKDLQSDADESKLEDEKELASNLENQENQIASAKVSITQSTLSTLSTLSKDSAAAQKAISLTEAGINIAKGVTAALGSAPPPINVALAGVTAAAGAVQLATIAGASFADGGLNTNYSRGGIGKGPSHSNGGIQMFSKGGRHTGEFQGGEAILTTKATSMFKPQLSAMNVAGGGKSFASGGVNLAGLSTSSIDRSIASESSISNSISGSGSIQVAVTDINRTQDNVLVKQIRASI